jgi:hypothetical protein
MVERLGLGASITWSAFFENPGILLNKVKQILGSSTILKKTAAFSAILEEYSVQNRYVELIEALMES